MTENRRQHLLALGLCALFFLVSSMWISRPGLQADEALFATGNFFPQGAIWSAHWFGSTIPLMQMSYLGSLKSWVYAPIFALFGAGTATVRLPMILAGAATLWLTYLLLRFTVSARAGLIAVALLALDPTFLWTTRCDWGPVGLQHLLVVAGVYAFARERSALGAFLLGLALWDKTVFVWTLAGLIVAAALVLHQDLRLHLSLRRAATVLAMFCLGALPLIAFNLGSAGETARQTAAFSLDELPAKAPSLVHSLGGYALWGYLARDLSAGPKSTLTPLLMGAAVIALPWLWRTLHRRAALFFLVLSLAAWLAMMATVGGGESSHHLVLLWPWPHCYLAIALASLPRRLGPIVAAAAVLSCASVTANHYVQLVRFGADPPWSDAVYRLHDFLAATPSTRIYATDWGIIEPLRLLSHGRLPLHHEAGLPPTLIDTEAILVGYVDRYQMFEGINARVEAAAAAVTPVGRRKVVVARIRDSHRIEVFEVFRLAPVFPK